MSPHVTILPGQAYRISREAAETGAAIGVSQSGNCLVISTGRKTVTINSGGFDIIPPNQETIC